MLIIKDQYSSEFFRNTDSHVKDEYKSGKKIARNYVGCAYTCYYIQGLQFNKLKILDTLKTTE